MGRRTCSIHSKAGRSFVGKRGLGGTSLASQIRVQKSSAGGPMTRVNTLLSHYEVARRTLRTWGASVVWGGIAKRRLGALAGTAHGRFDWVPHSLLVAVVSLLNKNPQIRACWKALKTLRR